ncbi:unnamed protein product [Peniophora sp. CBMAI 1063]|nr:unnamed protein product [Peniophora sp. CBMAI 1063]
MDSPGTPSSLSTKRKKQPTDDEEGQGGNKKPRTRVSYSCGECHRRKQKCDRQIPCSHCRARKVPELCKAYTPGKPDQDIHLRLARLEHIIEIALPQYASRSGTADRRSPSPSGGHSQADEDDLSGGHFQSGRWYGNTASGSIAPGSLLEQLQHAVPGASMAAIHDDKNVNELAATVIDSVRQDVEPTPADNLKALIQDCGVAPHKITELVQELPPQRFSTALIDFYFTAVNWTRYPISERDFRQSYSSVCTNGVSAHPNDVRFLPLLFVVLAISVRLSPDHIGGDARNRRLTSLRYYWASRRSLLIAAAIQPDSLDMVLTRLLSARFLTFDRRITECWSQLGAAVRTAQALGLHRDGGNMNMEPSQVEYRRRVWSFLYHADRSYALVLGRPNAIQDVYTSTHPPLNVEGDVTVADLRNPPALSVPTRLTFVILRHALAVIIGKIVHHFQQVRHASTYSDVIALDEELLKFLNTLPPHYSMTPDTSLDQSHPFIPAHRFLIITEVLFVRISLHRPYLLRKLSSDRYTRSREACFESAIQYFNLRTSYQDHVPRETRESLHSAYREFQSAMVAGIYLLLKPHGRLAGRMDAILDAFLKDHEGVREMDETTRRELRIIEFFKAKSKQMAEEEDQPMSPEGPDAEAQLLLAIQNGNNVSGTSTPRVNTKIATASYKSPALGNGAMAEGTSPLASSFFPSPTLKRLSGGEQTGSAGTGSPGGEDADPAQHLLDQWYNAVQAGQVGSAPLDPAFGQGVPWGGFGSSDVSGWFGAGAPLQAVPVEGAGAAQAADGGDWTYWETLVNEIRGAPVNGTPHLNGPGGSS